MHTVRRAVAAPPAAVWEVFENGWLFPTWVVGASRMRFVDPTWPAPGARLHHSVGAWPALLNDTTEVVAAERERELVLRAKVRPFGAADVRLEITPTRDRCEVSMAEDVTSGPSRFMPGPVRQAGFAARNGETLLRLAVVAEGMRRSRPAG